MISLQLFGNDTETVLIIFFCCHLVGLCSTLYNPIVYCYWNKAFKKEFLLTVRGIRSSAHTSLKCLHEGCHTNIATDVNMPNR